MSISIYAQPSPGVIYSPFNLRIDPMERLLLIGIEKDPDEVYMGFEPQLFTDERFGQGLRVLAWRRDGYVDIYQQPSLPPERNLDVAGKGLADLVVRSMDDARFEISAGGVDLHFAFEDKLGRSIEVTVSEKGVTPTKPFPLLAPVGSGSVSPSSFPLFMLYEFYFVRRNQTIAEITISGVRHQPDTFPLPMDGAKIYFMRYSADPFLAHWNVAHDGVLSPIRVTGPGTVEDQGVIYHLVESDGHCEVQRMTSAGTRHQVSIEYNPPVPELACLRDGANVQGGFTISCDELTGSVEGQYQVSRHGQQIEMLVHPSGGWLPKPQTWFLKFLFTAAKVFRSWPKTYLWTAMIELGQGCQPTMESRWERRP